MSRRLAPALVLGLTGLLMACSGAKPDPQPPPAQQPPAQPPPRTLRALTLEPSTPSVRVGQSLLLTATGSFSDATSQNLTESVVWSSSEPEIATVSNQEGPRGLVFGATVGQATLTATHAESGKSARVEVTVHLPPPVLQRISPTTGSTAGGTTLFLNGGYFTPDTTVTLGGVALVGLTRVNELTLNGTTPPGSAGARDVVVTNANGSVTLPGAFTYVVPPTATRVEPDSGTRYGGTRITVQGSDFTPDTRLSLGGAWTPATFVDANTLTALTPPGTEGASELVVSNEFGSSTLTSAFRYYEPWQPASTGLAGGNVMVLASAPDNPSLLYAGTLSNGVFKSTDAGSTWVPSSKGLTTLDIRSLAVDPTAPSTVYAGTNWGLFKSTDGGANWSESSLTTLSISSLVIDPVTPTTLYVGEPGMGVLKSTDAGATWTPVNTGVSNKYVEVLALDPTRPQVLYAAAKGDVFKTTDGGANWSLSRAGLPPLSTRSYALRLDPKAPDVVYVARDDGLFKSTDGGASWSPASSGLSSKQVYALAIDPNTPSTLYAGCYNGLFRSRDGGESWIPMDTGLTSRNVRALLINPAAPEVLYAGTARGGVFKTTTGGTSWFAANLGLTGLRIHALAFAPSRPDTAYAGTENGVFKTTDSGASWVVLSQVLGDLDVRAVAVHPTLPTTAYAGTPKGLFKTTTGGESWFDVSPPTAATSLLVSAVAFHPTSPNTLYVGTSLGLYKTTDGGASWARLTQGLPTTSFSVLALAIDPQTPSTVYAASSTDIYKSTNDGTQWTKVSTGLPSNAALHALAVAPGTTAVYATSMNQGLYKTVEGGANWTKVLAGNVFGLAIDPTDPQTLYVGTLGDIRGTRDGGSTWRSVSAYYSANVWTLAFNSGAPLTLLAGTNGRGIYMTATGAR